MKSFFKKNAITISGALLGSIAGFLYWKNVGCVSGTCYIQSNPYSMTLYGAFIGVIVFNLFQPKTKQQQYEIEN
jgi:hypothetical protein